MLDFTLILCVGLLVFDDQVLGNINGNTKSVTVNDKHENSHMSRANGKLQAKSDCTVDSCPEKDEYDSIKFLHRQIDDDANGDIDISETDGFLREELKYESRQERHKGFHRNDKHISLSELWDAWKSSEVHNWTVEDTISWLTTSIELPQYAKVFQDNLVDGSSLPKMASNNGNFMTSVLGIKDPIHRQKIVLKAMDVVLFGPPRDRNLIKDAALIMLFVVAVGGCWFAYVQYRHAQKQMKKMMSDMDHLQKAEDALTDLQRELDKAKQEQENVADEKRKLERRLRDEKSKDSDTVLTEDECFMRMRILEHQVEALQNELDKTERMLEQHQSQWVAPPSLQLWLQLTYEIELKNYTAKKTAAEQQLVLVKEVCEKLRKKRTQLLGSFRIAHGSSIDDIDHKILEAKTALYEVTQDLKERLQRWQQIEALCGFTIVKNPGLSYLQSILYGTLDGRLIRYSSASHMQRKDSSETLLDDDLSPSAVQRLVSMSANLFLAPVPPESIKNFTPLSVYNRRGNNGHLLAKYNRPANASSSTGIASQLRSSNSTNHIFTNGSLPRELTFPRSLNSASQRTICPDSHSTISDSQSLLCQLQNAATEKVIEAVLTHVNDTANGNSDKQTKVIHAGGNNYASSEDVAVADDVHPKPVFSVGESSNVVESADSQTCAEPVANTTNVKTRPPNSRQSSSDSFNQLPSSHESSVSPPRNGRKNKLSSLFKSRSSSGSNLGALSTADDCSTDSGSVNEEIKYRKKKLFLNLKKSKTKLASSP